MPPKGLYTMPRHHLYGATFSRRPTFSAMNLSQDQVEETPSTNEGVDDETAKPVKEPAEKNRKKKHKKHRGKDNRHSSTNSTDKKNRHGDPDNARGTTAKEKERSKKLIDAVYPSSSKKKRKRESGATMLTQTPTSDAAETSANQKNGRHEKKKSRKRRNSTTVNDDVDLVALNKLLTPYEKLQLRPKDGLENKFKGVADVAGVVNKKVKPKASPSDFASGEAEGVSERARKTPIPIPPPSTISAMIAKWNRPPQTVGELVKASEVVVPETPPSIAAKTPRVNIKTPIPFPSLTSMRAPATTSKLDDRHHAIQAPTSSSPMVHIEPPGSAPPVMAVPGTKYNAIEILSQSECLPRSTLTQPLVDEPKPRPIARSSRGNSTTPTSSRASSISIPEMFSRIEKSCSRAHGESEPLMTTENKKATIYEAQGEASMNVFNSKFSELLLAVNFPAEEEYFNQYLDWHAENNCQYPFPCLGGGSGCTPKKEEILRLSKAEDINILKVLEINGGDEEALRDAKERTAQAEEFLTFAVRASIPIPIGRLEGKWTLYCPKYAENHFDRYGYGSRTLEISRISGFKNSNSYVGRLSIPPRSMVYSILAFVVPPHASFRTVTIKTASEGYSMDVIFLGNGYLCLRVDLQLLLKGKPTELVGGKKVYMEFVGIHEKAVEWVNKKEHVEKGGRKAFAKYDGVESD